MPNREPTRLTSTELDELLFTLSISSSGESPSEEELTRYLKGKSSPEEADRIRLALAGSGEGRQNLMSLAAIAGRSLEFQALRPPPAPPRRAGRSAVGATRIILGLAAVLAVAVGLFSGLRAIHHDAYHPGFLTESRPLYREQFEADQLRGTGEPPPLVAARNQREAALLAFRQVLVWTDGRLEVRDRPSSPPPTGARELELVTPGGRHLSVALPAGSTQVRLARLTLPGLELSWADVPPGTSTVALENPPAGATRTLLAVTYQDHGEYRAEPVPLSAS